MILSNILDQIYQKDLCEVIPHRVFFGLILEFTAITESFSDSANTSTQDLMIFTHSSVCVCVSEVEENVVNQLYE